jgi:hypothetical protein
VAGMNNIHRKIADIDWQTVTGQMNKKGYALVSTFYLISLVMK